MQVHGRNGIIATPGPDYNVTRCLDEIKTHDSLVRSQGCRRSLLSGAAGDHEIADKYLHGLAVLI